MGIDSDLEQTYRKLEVELSRMRLNLTKKTDRKQLLKDMKLLVADMKQLNKDIEHPPAKPVARPVKKPKSTVRKVGYKRLLESIDRSVR